MTGEDSAEENADTNANADVNANDCADPLEGASGAHTEIAVRQAVNGDALDVRRILDAALLDVDTLDARLGAGDVLVAVESTASTESGGDAAAGSDADATDRILGACVLESQRRGAHVAAIAVRKRRRDRGIGTALVEAAAERNGRLSARFDERVRPFYESLGFSIDRIERADGRRFEGVRESPER